VDLLVSAAGRFRAHGVAVSDACFGVRRAWRRDFLRRLVERRPSFWFVFETRPEFLTAEDMDLLAGLKVEIQLGIESCSPRMLQLMRKSRAPEQFLERFATTSRALSERRILHRANLIFNHPGETVQSLEETFGFMDRLLADRDSYLMWAAHGYMHFPGCEIERERARWEREFGARFDAGDWWKGDRDQYETSMRVAPSTELAGADRDLWRRLLAARLEALEATLAPAALDFARRKYYIEQAHELGSARP